jgi:hypothetical protein
MSSGAHPLAGVDSAIGRTPTHGTDRAPTPAPADPLLAAHLARAHEPCPNCRFDLHGLGVGRCPECGVVLRLGVLLEGRGGVMLTRRALAWPFGAGLALGVSGMAFSTFVRREHDDWKVGLAVALVWLGLLVSTGAIHSVLRARLTANGALVLLALLWVAVGGASGLAWFLDI